MNPLPDAATRRQAQDVANSCAVQAPAGSGKTELLSLRFLRLLAVCDRPEEILAITFTRKAANEMASRIIETLEWAATVAGESLATDLDRERHHAAQAVLQRDRQLQWRLLDSPARLRIQTIDSFCRYLANRLPVLSGFGGPLQVSDDIDDCYQQAIQELFTLLDADLPVSRALRELMLHLNNDLSRLQKLLAELLQQRDQWIDIIMEVASSPEEAFNLLFANVIELIEDSLQHSRELTQPFESRLAPLANFAAGRLLQSETESAITHCAGLEALPPPESSALRQWQGLAGLLMTADLGRPAWRKQVDRRQGFPAPSAAPDGEAAALYRASKEAMTALLKELADSEHGSLLESLHYLRLLPNPLENSFSFELLHTLTKVLPMLLAQLDITFAGLNKVDHTQVSHAALQALGTEDNPTDLLLSLDYRIRHILVDEFQDTSSSQLKLLRKLTAGWEADDGRTFFAVGDAMQSCYGFRNANVGLFISVRSRGINAIPLQALDLKTNFRSDAGIVAWVNLIFQPSFPRNSDVSRGAVCYSPATPHHPPGPEPAVSTRVYSYEEDQSAAFGEEARHIAAQAGELQRQNRARPADEKQDIAILVRSRSHLLHILPALRAAGISWQATEIDNLNNVAIVADLLILTRALCNPADRLAWLALLRSPFGGIPLPDLLVIAGDSARNRILSGIRNPATIALLSEESQRRLGIIAGVLNRVVLNRDRFRVNALLRQAFTALGGNIMVRTNHERESVELFFELVAATEVAGEIIDLDEFEAILKRTAISDSPQETGDLPIQIMTIHKSKGLEFDHVFLPGLARVNKVDDRELLLWHERLNRRADPRLFLAALAGAGESGDKLYDLIRYEKSVKSELENTRLMYIAVTRARKTAHLSAGLKCRDGKLIDPGSRSLLHTIWDALLQERQITVVPVVTTAQPTTPHGNPLREPATLVRVPLAAMVSTAEKQRQAPDPETEESPADRQLETHRQTLQTQIGNLVHQALQVYVADRKLFAENAVPWQRIRWKTHLEQYGFEQSSIARALDFIEESIHKVISAEDINWIFDGELKNSATELCLQSRSGHLLRNHIIDRTFIDRRGIRWIIDYKSIPQPADVSQDEFISRQKERYQDQLDRYKELFSSEENTGIKTALLLTAIPVLAEYKVQESVP